MYTGHTRIFIKKIVSSQLKLRTDKSSDMSQAAQDMNFKFQHNFSLSCRIALSIRFVSSALGIYSNSPVVNHESAGSNFSRGNDKTLESDVGLIN